MPKKIDLVNGTYKLIRISGLTSEAIPEEIETALQVADDYAGTYAVSEVTALSTISVAAAVS